METLNRDELVREAEELVTRSDGDLTGADAKRFEDIETTIATLDYRAEVEKRREEMARSPFAEVLDASANGGHVERRRQLPPIQFDDETVRRAWDEFQTRGAAQLEARAVPLPVAPSTVPDYVRPPFDKRIEPTRIGTLLPSRPVTG